MNSTNYSFSETKEIFYLKIGSTWILDSLYVYLNTTMALVAFILNLISLFTFRKIDFKNKNLKRYLMVYSVCLLIPCFFLTFLFLSRAPRYFSFSFTLLATVNRCKLSYWISPTFSYMVRFLDCFILTERISYFVPKLEKFPNTMLLKCLCLHYFSLFLSIHHIFSF